MTQRWSTDRVARLAPGPGSVRAALGLTDPARWQTYGATSAAVWGLVAGSGKSPHRTVVDISGGSPAFSCSCPSRTFPCKHALAVLLLWAADMVPEENEPPEFAAAWLAARAARPAVSAGPRPRDEEAAATRAAQRAQRVAGGLAELEIWLRDQVRTGLAQAAAAGHGPVEQVAARMVDAQAPGVASMVRRTAGLPATGAGWPERLLQEYARLRLLVRAYAGIGSLPPELAAVVRARIGFTVPRDEVLTTPGVRDRWYSIATRELLEGKVQTRRIWLRGARSGRCAMVLLFAAGPTEIGDHPDAVLRPGVELDADLHFYPGAPPLRALVGQRHGEPVHGVAPPQPSGGFAELLAGYAAALADDPWLGEWPALVTATPEPDGTGGWRLRDAAGAVAPVIEGGVEVWPLVAASGGHPLPIAGEWTARGLRPLTTWHRGRAVRL